MKQYEVTGMSCAACSARVEKAVSKIEGVTSCSVNLLTNSMGVEGAVDAQTVIEAVEAAGYKAAEKESRTGQEAGRMEKSGELKDKETPEMKNTLMLDPSINQVYGLLQEAGTVIFSVGPFDMQHTFLTVLGEDVTEHLRGFNGAGNFAGRTYDFNGMEFHTHLYDRLMSLPIKELATKKKRICIAVGNYKAKAILGLLRGKIVNLLYTDTQTAKEVLKEHKRLLVKMKVKDK